MIKFVILYCKVEDMKKFLKNLKFLISKMDRSLLIVTILFFLFGLLNIVTASSREAVVRYEVSTYYYFFKQSQMLIIGLIGSYIILNMKTKAYQNLIWLAYILVLGLVILLFPFGKEVNGATNWLPIPGVGTVQPSELAKPVMIVLFAVLFEQNCRVLNSDNPKKWSKIGLILIVACLIPALTFVQKDLSWGRGFQ